MAQQRISDRKPSTRNDTQRLPRNREFEGIVGACGIKDAVRGLADALSGRQIKVVVFIPRYAFVKKGKQLCRFSLGVNGKRHVLSVLGANIGAIEVRLLDSECFNSKQEVYTYTENDAPSFDMIGKGHLDVHEMNTALQAGAIRSILREGRTPDIIHGHDGHTGLLALLIKKCRAQGFFGKTACLSQSTGMGTLRTNRHDRTTSRRSANSAICRRTQENQAQY